MPQYDAHHEAVKQALLKDGWSVTREQFSVLYKGLRVFIDMAAEKFVDGEDGSEKIAIEVKVFDQSPFLSDFEKAIGQYSLYRFMLRKVRIKRRLFLAVSEKASREFFSIPAVTEYTTQHRIHLLIFDPESEEILKWNE
jgi:hypothetical protein